MSNPTKHLRFGKHQKAMAKFYQDYSGLHKLADDATTQKTAKSLQARGFLEINEFGQAQATKKLLAIVI